MSIRRVAALALSIGIAFAAHAGEYHSGATLFCADCHTMHSSMSHRFDGEAAVSAGPAAGGNWFSASGPHDYLLKASSPLQLCLACHDGQTFAPDVRGENTTDYVRQAGALTTGAAPYENFKGHTLGIRATAPGGFANLTLECINCHAYHGNTAYRNVDAITYAKGHERHHKTRIPPVAHPR